MITPTTIIAIAYVSKLGKAFTKILHRYLNRKYVITRDTIPTIIVMTNSMPSSLYVLE